MSYQLKAILALPVFSGAGNINSIGATQTSSFPKFSVTVRLCAMSVRQNMYSAYQILRINRKLDPYKVAYHIVVIYCGSFLA